MASKRKLYFTVEEAAKMVVDAGSSDDEENDNTDNDSEASQSDNDEQIDEQREHKPPYCRPKCQDSETMKWTKRDNRLILHNFTKSSGIQQKDRNADRSISDLFACFYPNELIDHITVETNRYATAHPLPPLQPGK